MIIGDKDIPGFSYYPGNHSLDDGDDDNSSSEEFCGPSSLNSLPCSIIVTNLIYQLFEDQEEKVRFYIETQM